jgi:hypothetical protein
MTLTIGNVLDDSFRDPSARRDHSAVGRRLAVVQLR